MVSWNGKTLASLRGKVVSLSGFLGYVVRPVALMHFRRWRMASQPFYRSLVILGMTRYYGQGEGYSMDNASEIEFLKRFQGQAPTAL
jgi:hypothetical protein